MNPPSREKVWLLLRTDLTADKETTSDLRIFAEYRFKRVALTSFLQSPWPEQSLFDEVISRAVGLFIFIETLALALEHCDDPAELLKASLQDSAGAGLMSLYGLYSKYHQSTESAKECRISANDWSPSHHRTAPPPV